MPPDMRYTIGRQKEISISILNSEKPRRSRLRGFSYLLGAGRSNLRMATSLLSVHPFADVVATTLAATESIKEISQSMLNTPFLYLYGGGSLYRITWRLDCSKESRI